MMILRSAPASPFGRKVKIAAALLGLSPRIDVVASDTLTDMELRQQNPLGKIPTLVREDGIALYDSRVILEYLDHLAGGGRIIPRDPEARFAALTLQALADGLMDAALLRVYETRFRTEERREPKWDEYQAGKIVRALAQLEAAPPVRKKGADTVGTIATACALGYLDLRFEGSWRQDHPRMVAWLDSFSADVPAFAATRFVP